MNKKWILLFMLTMVIGQLHAAPITLESLLEDMLDRTQIATFPEPEFICKQVSSYDRSSKTPDDPSWFANSDWSNFLRVDEVDGRRERVMMDQEGPGAIVRWWITGRGVKGTIRVYLDGADEPVFQGKAEELIGGDILLGAPLSAERSKGRNLYLPIPFSKHCKITYDGVSAKETNNGGDHFYYNINYRLYPKAASVETFTMADFKASADLIDSVQKRLLAPDDNQIPASRTASGDRKLLKPSKSLTQTVKKGGAICSLKIRIDADKLSQAMRSTVISAEFDGQQTVWAPIGDFFGTGTGLNPYQGWWRQVDEDGWMVCYWPMPFKKKATVTVTNYGSDDVTVEMDDIGVAKWKWTDRTMYFHSSWRSQNNIEVMGTKDGKKEDWNYVTVKGKGVYAGDTLTIFNRGTRWWGEGDEKIFVDGETFPSHFGTGSEDYFGYAWCWPGNFTAPFHAQPNGSGNKRPGHSTNTRVRLLDGIPFEKSLKFDMELWHWKTTTIDYATTTYWYAFEGAADIGVVDPEKVAEKIGKVSLIIEGEATQLRNVSGGFTEAQSGDWGASGGKHLWWKYGKEGDTLDLAIQIPQAGEYDVMLKMLTAADYGRFRIMLDGKEVSASEDFYTSQGVEIKQIKAGCHYLEKGEHLLSFTILEKNPSARAGNMLGLDYLELKKMD